MHNRKGNAGVRELYGGLYWLIGRPWATLINRSHGNWGSKSLHLLIPFHHLAMRAACCAQFVRFAKDSPRGYGYKEYSFASEFPVQQKPSPTQRSFVLATRDNNDFSFPTDRRNSRRLTLAFA
jgi:hypothetical protein